MQPMDSSPLCPICLQNAPMAPLQCAHTFCTNCVKGFLVHMKLNNTLTPNTMTCPSCPQPLPDTIIKQLFPGEQGFVLCIVRKRYLEAKDENVRVWGCKGYLTIDRKCILQKSATSTQKEREQFGKKITQQAKKMAMSQTLLEGIKNCNNILSLNTQISRKQNYIQCNVCNVLYCLNCFDFVHEGSCAIKNIQEGLDEKYHRFVRKSNNPVKKQTGQVNNGNDNENNSHKNLESDTFLHKNGLLQCLNPRCGVFIDKEQGCFWVKCRCSYEMCYPCKKLWGDCEHFSKYPYKKFTPPPEWMVKALKLY